MTDGAPETEHTSKQSVVANDTHDGNDVMNGRDASQDNAATDAINDVQSENLTEQSPPPTVNNETNDNVDFEEEEPETQESFTQHEMTQTGNDLTQMGLFDDDDGNDCNDDDDDDANSRQPMIDPLTLPWGRLMPVGSNGVALPAAASAVTQPLGGGEDNPAVASTSAATSSLRPSTREAIEMLPRPPESRTITRSRSPSLDTSSAAAKTDDNDDGNSQHEDGLTFLGLKNLLSSDRFNEYVLGRSAKADITAQKLDNPITNTNNLTEQQKQQEEKKRKSHDYIHAMISNRHCRIYCLLNLPNKPNNTISNNSKNNHPPEMEVFVEDTSGNGTLINGTTLLRKNERRKLHTGDVICLLNPKLLYKKIRNGNERKRYMQQYSYVFVNLYEQERHWNYNYSSSQSLCGVGGVGVGSPVSFLSSVGRKSQGNNNTNGNSNSSNGKSTAVNPRATRCHSTSVGSRDDLTRRKVNGQSSSNAATTVAAATNVKGGGPPAISRKPSLGSFLNNQSSSSRRRVEDEYDLRDLLGSGTCGEVRRAIHRRTGNERAVKIISITERGMGGANFFSKEKLSAIQAEAEILRSLDHPYVVKLFDVFVAPGKAIYLVMELIRGGDLFDRIVERERYTEVHARRLFRRILSAVYYLHEQRGVVHRDLKPENILVVDRRSDVDIKLTDFGLAKNLTAEGLKTFCGTPQYFAPEVLRRRNTVMGNGRYGKEIDCWSIGVILFILLSGSPPFDVSAGFDAVASAKVVFYEDQWKDISSEARNLVRSLLEKDAKKRMSVKEACEHPWVLVDDGDTHCHPLQDPVVTPNAPDAIKSTELKPPVESNAKKEAISDAQAMPTPPSQHIESPKKMAAKESPNPASDKRTQKTFLSKSAPQLSKIEHSRNYDSKHSRNSSMLSLCDEASATKKIFEQAVDVPEHQCPSSPISAKLLFAKASNEGSVRKMSKQDVESIKTAGNTLPKPSLSAGSRLLPKKKIQQQLGVDFKKAETSKSKVPKDASKPASQSSSDKENDTSDKKRKLSSSTVTPPGEEHTLVFRLNKKRKTGKHIAAKEQDDTTNAVKEPSQKTELSEDELMSDFSDDEGGDKLSKPAKKRKIDAFLHKKTSGSIQSAASIQSLDSKGTKSSTARISLSPKAPGALKIETNNEAKVGTSRGKREKTSVSPPKSKKKKQTFLFGKPPPNGLESTMAVESSPVVDDADTGAICSELNPPIEGEGEESVELERQSSNESLAGQATNSTKGKQKSIKNWFLPKK
eukprot:CAMPEP_0201741886 /NCGR_PEP_ID=MMETSP0593-20130828/47038_1 /ASSEMBLY_ACC=CAM_ASM_000672 /TAXON_ID=267983 /ORGANISM="Skeletonema japonicum, Strain CCMP2506" /LENGTH=1254 /DNA_ID=CAMNT_0048236225 /DNA_START=144 /DNA_END=3908 /DNA_ORIENTATION=+